MEGESAYVTVTPIGCSYVDFLLIAQQWLDRITSGMDTVGVCEKKAVSE